MKIIDILRRIAHRKPILVIPDLTNELAIKLKNCDEKIFAVEAKATDYTVFSYRPEAYIVNGNKYIIKDMRRIACDYIRKYNVTLDDLEKFNEHTPNDDVQDIIDRYKGDDKILIDGEYEGNMSYACSMFADIELTNNDDIFITISLYVAAIDDYGPETGEELTATLISKTFAYIRPDEPNANVLPYDDDARTVQYNYMTQYEYENECAN